MAFGMSMLGFAALEKSLKSMIPGPTDVWEIGPSTDYDVYVELGTKWNLFTGKPMPARPCVRYGMENAMTALSELEAKAANMNSLLRMLALRIEREIKISMREVIYAHPGTITPTGNLLRSVEVNKR